MPSRNKTRQEDERDLLILQWLDEGYEAASIARHLGMSSSRVRGFASRVRADERDYA